VNASKSEVALNFSHPIRQVTLMLIVIGLVALGVYVALPKILPVFLANPYLNGVIVGVFLIGVIACFSQVGQLASSVRWIERFTGVRPQTQSNQAPRLLAPLASLMRERGAQSQMSSTSSRSILDSVATRIDEDRDITRYISNVLIFLGLLGTFYGLATTVPALVDTIRALSPSEGEGASDVFARLMTGLERQLGGMGTAFASSLLGLAGSLVVGLLELFASHGQNRFFRELEEWMSSITRIGFAGAEEGADADAMLAYMGQHMEVMQTLFEQSEQARAANDERVGLLTASLERLVDQAENDAATPQALAQLAANQDRLIAILDAQNEAAPVPEPMPEPEAQVGVDAESRMRLRSIDVQLLRILEEMSVGRQESTEALRSEIAALTRAFNDIAEQGQ
jgi:hypothetical protein